MTRLLIVAVALAGSGILAGCGGGSPTKPTNPPALKPEAIKPAGPGTPGGGPPAPPPPAPPPPVPGK